MSLDILLVNPPLTLEERYGAFASVGSQAPPLGLCYLAAMVRKTGHRAAILDAPALSLDLAATVREVGNAKAALIGITATTASIIRASELAQGLRAGGVRSPIFIGGAHVSALPEQTLREFPEFDLGVINEGEQTLVEVIEAYKSGSSYKDIRGVVFRDLDDIVTTLARPLIENLDELPFPAWDLIPDLAKHYKPAPHSYFQLPSSSLMTSRGCNGTCTFCARPFMGERYRSNSPEYTLAMVDHLVRHYGVRDIMFYDDNFLLDRGRVLKICDALLSRDYRISWSCLARTDLTPKDFYETIHRAGCWQIAYGIESGDQDILNNMKKNVKIDRVVQMIQQANSAGITTRGYFMIGCPGETSETIEKTIDFMRDSRLKEFHVTFCTPMPGAELFDTWRRWGAFDCDWRKLGFWDPVFIPAGMTREELIEGHRRMFRKFYLRPSVIARYIVKIIRRPRIMLNIFRAGWNVIRYSMEGYFSRKVKKTIRPS